MTRRIAYFSAAPLLSLIVFYRVFRTWFLNDDFGWMALRFDVQTNGLLSSLFSPQAQGTVRVLSERLPFLIFSRLFWMNPLPHRILAFSTWIVALTLGALIGNRLTGSRAAGLVAASLWAVNATLTQPLAWASDYNQVLCAACILMAFYARLRGWRVAEWAAYLAGFGVLEIIVLYPVLAALYAWCFDRKTFRSTLPLFIPSAIFTAIHLFFIPNMGGDEYRIAVDGRIFATLLNYLKWAAGPARLYEFTGDWQTAGLVATFVLWATILIFALWRIRKRDPLPVFCLAWFLCLLAPVLVLPRHPIDYAVTTPFIGIAWLASDAVLRGWRMGLSGRIAAGALTALYLVPMIYETGLYTDWFMQRSLRMRALMDGITKAQRAHPGNVFVIQGIDSEMMQCGVDDDPFRLIGATVFLAPGDEKNIVVPFQTLNLKRWAISPDNAFSLVESGKARVLTLAGRTMRDTTPIYRALARQDFELRHREILDVSSPGAGSRIGSGWYPSEDHIRWMQKSATVMLTAPTPAAKKLIVTGYSPAPLLAAGPVTLRFTANGRPVGKGVVTAPDQPFSFEFPWPDTLAGEADVELKIEASRTYRPPKDPRELGMAFRTFALR